MKRSARREAVSWLLLGVLLALGGVLGVLQYRWIGEVAHADHERLRQSLQTSLELLSADFNLAISAEIRALLPPGAEADAGSFEPVVERRYAAWRQTSRHPGLLYRVAAAEPRGDAASLRVLDPGSGVFRDAEWPAEWQAIRERAEPLRGWPFGLRRGPPGPPPGQLGLVFEAPNSLSPPPSGPASAPFERRNWPRLIIELDRPYIRDAMLPEFLQRHLGKPGTPDYEVAVLTRGNSPEVIYPSDEDLGRSIAAAADASVALLEPQLFEASRPPGHGVPPEGARGGGRGRGLPAGRWELYVRHRVGSLEAVVSAARTRNLAAASGVLLLLVASSAALIRLTRRAQRLAELQMDFVAGVGHELRTPLTVIRTAAYNLRGKLARDPGQVERYGALIEQESGRLAGMVDQVMHFASAEAGRPAVEREPLSVAAVLEEALESSRAVLEEARCAVETAIDPDLPPVLGDPAALQRAFGNLLSNAAKHGSKGDGWIGVAASRAGGKKGNAVEIRVSDRGPGIPAEEQRQVFDPFFRGRRAVRDQVHGSGLGLNLVKRIVEAHGGSVRVRSEPGRLTEFVVRIPVLAREQEDECTDSADRG